MTKPAKAQNGGCKSFAICSSFRNHKILPVSEEPRPNADPAKRGPRPKFSQRRLIVFQLQAHDRIDWIRSLLGQGELQLFADL